MSRKKKRRQPQRPAPQKAERKDTERVTAILNLIASILNLVAQIIKR